MMEKSNTTWMQESLTSAWVSLVLCSITTNFNLRMHDRKIQSCQTRRLEKEDESNRVGSKSNVFPSIHSYKLKVNM